MLNSFFDQPYLNPSYRSLAIELQFYLMISVLVLLRGTRHLLDLALLWLLLASVPLLPWRHAAIDPLYYGSAAMWAPYFTCGVALYFLWQDGMKLKPALVLLLAWLLCFHYIRVDVDSVKPVGIPGKPFSVSAGFTLFSLFLGLILLICLGVVALGPSTWTRWAGGTSYPLYLLRETVGFTLLNRLRGNLAAGVLMPAIIVLMVLASTAIWRFAELPAQRWLRHRLPANAAKTAPAD